MGAVSIPIWDENARHVHLGQGWDYAIIWILPNSAEICAFPTSSHEKWCLDIFLQDHRCGKACTTMAQVQDTISHQYTLLHSLLLTSAPLHSSLSAIGNRRNQDLEGVRWLDWRCVINNCQRNKVCLTNKRVSLYSNKFTCAYVYMKLMASISFISAHFNHIKQWVSLWQFHIFISYTLIILNPHYLLPPFLFFLTLLLLLNRHLSQVTLLSPLSTRPILDSSMPQTDEGFTKSRPLSFEKTYPDLAVCM